jgi:hypothetical protein
MSEMARFAIRTTLPTSEVDDQRYLDDITRLASVGCRLARVRIPWSTFVPQPARVDPAVRERLAAFVDGIRAVGVEPHISLCGRKVPGWFVDDHAFTDQRSADQHWSFFVDEVIASLDANVGGVIPFESPLNALRGLHGASLGPDTHDLRRFLSAIECVAFLVQRTISLCGSLTVTCVIDRPSLAKTAETLGLASLPDEAASRLTNTVRDSEGRCVVGVDVSAHPQIGDAPERWAATMTAETLRIAETLASYRFSLIGVPDRDEPDAVAAYADCAVRAAAELADAGIHIDAVWLGDHLRMPTSVLPQW